MTAAARRAVVRESLALRRELRRCVHPARLRRWRFAQGARRILQLEIIAQLPGFMETIDVQMGFSA